MIPGTPDTPQKLLNLQLPEYVQGMLQCREKLNPSLADDLALLVELAQRMKDVHESTVRDLVNDETESRAGLATWAMDCDRMRLVCALLLAVEPPDVTSPL